MLTACSVFFFLSYTFTTSCLLSLAPPPLSFFYFLLCFMGMKHDWAVLFLWLRLCFFIGFLYRCMTHCSPTGGFSHPSPQTCVSPPTAAPLTPLRFASMGWGLVRPTPTSQRWDPPSCTPAHRPSLPSPESQRSPCRPPGPIPFRTQLKPPAPPDLSRPRPSNLWHPASPTAPG